MKRNWLGAPQEIRTSLPTNLFNVLSRSCSTSVELYPRLVIKRVCLALAAVSIVSSVAELKAYLQQALNAARTKESIVISLDMLSAICDELESGDLSYSQKEQVERELLDVVEHVLQFLQHLINNVPELRVEAFKCLGPWVRLLRISVPTMYSEKQPLLKILLDGLAGPTECAKTAAYILIDVLEVREYPSACETDEVSSLEFFGLGLLQTRDSYTNALTRQDETTCHAVSSVISKFSEIYLPWIVHGWPTGLDLIDLMLLYTSHPKRLIASLLLDFWLELQSYSIEERHPRLREPVYTDLLTILIQQCTYPLDFTTSWDNYHGDICEDDFSDFRSGSQGAGEVLQSTYAILKSEYIAQLITVMEEHLTSWQHVESALFALATVSKDINETLNENHSKYDIERTRNMLDTVFRELCSNMALSSHPITIRTASKLFGEFASLFNLEAYNTTLLQQVARYLMSALNVQEAQETSSVALRQICVSCCQYFDRVGGLDELVDSLDSVIATGLDVTYRSNVVEGITRATASLESSRALAVLSRLVSPMLSRMSAYFSTPHGDSIPQLVADELTSMSVMMRFLDAPTLRSSAVQILQLIWPVLDPCVSLFHSDGRIMSALFDFYGWALQTVREQMVSELPRLAQLITAAYKTSRFCSALECSTRAIDVFGKTDDAAMIQSFSGLFSMLSQTTFEHFQNCSPVEETDLVVAFFEMAYHYILFCPAAVCLSREFSTLIQLSVACVGNQHRESTRAVNIFLVYLISKSEYQLKAFEMQIQTCIGENINPLILTIIRGLGNSSPTVLFQSLSDLLYALLVAYGQNCQEALQAALSDSSTGSDAFSPDEKAKVLQLLLGLSQVGQSKKFRLLTRDIAQICRHQASSDNLLSYEI